MSLDTYKSKRRFDETSEPKALENKDIGKKKLIFVVQKHSASHLHYDFRLEKEGVLKSWAVPKGPPSDPSEKRLAIAVEDHPFEYAKFHGSIPEGNYGAGMVEIWDSGTYVPIKSNSNHWEFILDGKKLKGEFSLIKIGRRPGLFTRNKNDNNWLFIKKEEDEKLETTIRKLGRDKMPHQIQPMLASLVDKPFTKSGWLFEIKWDGYRAISEIQNGKVKLYSRNLLSFENKFPSIIDDLKKIPHNVVLDGEIVALDAKGMPTFQGLQYYSRGDNKELIYYVFDILYIDGKVVQNETLKERKKILSEIISKTGSVVLGDSIEREGVEYFMAAKEKGIEGIMAKNSTSPYRQGVRGSEWLKIKTHLRQETIICGFTKPKGSREDFGALILGVFKGKTLTYCGNVGTGFDEKELGNLHDQLKDIIRKKPLFPYPTNPDSDITWVEPKLICEVKFQEWTRDGLMRQPVFMGLREDKNPKDVNEEKVITKENYFGAEPPKERGAGNLEILINSRKLSLTHSNKVFWPNEGYTKKDLIQYYREISSFILPYLKDRPESLKRYPDGIKGGEFFHKNVEVAPTWIKTEPVQSGNKIINYLLCQNEESLIYLINLGCIDLNPWNSRIGNLEKPDYLILDLDPLGVSFKEVIKTALVIREVLETAEINSVIKTSGATGMHIYIPMGARYTYEQTRQLAQIITIKVNQKIPLLTSLDRNPESRMGRVYLDVFQNAKGQTLASPYSVRPSPGASVSTPLDWGEVNENLTPQQFNITNMVRRLNKVGDLFKLALGSGINMEKALSKLQI